MLIEFSVANYKSIKDKVTLSMVASSEKEHPENIFEVKDKKIKLLKSVAIYGANASGKSNLIEALNFMSFFVIRSATKFQKGDKIPVEPFRFDFEYLTKPSEFEIAFIKDNERYIYGFTADNQMIHEEWLTATRTTKPRGLFRREIDSSNEINIHFGKSWIGEGKSLKEHTRENALFLSVAMQYNNMTVKPVFEWFMNNLGMLAPERLETKQFIEELALDYTMRVCQNDEEMKSKAAEMLRNADVGIVDFEIIELPFAIKLKNNGKNIQGPISETEIIHDIKSIYLHRKVRTRHKISLDNDVFDIDFFLDNESDGTRQFFSLIGPWLYTLRNGSCLVIDELDTSLHPLLTRYLIKLVHERKINHTNPQLIFTTHDCGLLDSDLFRRDQIWFTEKNETGATDLFSLWDYKNVRKENYRKNYLHGKYGAIPFIGEFKF